MSVYLNPSLIMSKAASKVRGERYFELRELCDKQKTISTKKLMQFIVDFEGKDRLDAIQLREIADYLRQITVYR